MLHQENDSHHFMYVVSCADGTLYTGYTTDVEHRVVVHNAGKGAKYTRSRLPVRLVAQARFIVFTRTREQVDELRFREVRRIP